MTGQALRVSLDTPLPKSVRVGAGTAVLVAGTCFAGRSRISELELLVAGEPQALQAFGMPRLDYFASLHPRLEQDALRVQQRDEDSKDDPLLMAYRSGFWGLAEIRPRKAAGAIELRLRACLETGETAEAPLARIELEDAPPARIATAWHAGCDEARVAICMATYNPPAGLFARQIASIREQSHRNWICLISDDRSNQEAFARITAEVGDDPRFILSRSRRRLGFFSNFERALAMAPSDADYVALADQDDHWYRDKIATLVSKIGSAELIYSDARIVAADGTVLSGTYWARRSNNHTDLLSLLVANSVTGAASLMRRELLDYALPFPPAQFAHYHDHWIALTALALGEIAFVEEPLYDYVQHRGASLGHAAANRMPRVRDRLLAQRNPRERIRMWRLHYFADYCRLLQMATILELRCGPGLSPKKRRTLVRFGDASRISAPLLQLAGRGARELIGRPQTLGAEWMLVYALLWRRLLSLSARERPQRRLRLDAVPPPTLAVTADRVSSLPAPVRELAQKIAPLELAVADDAPVRVNLLIPTVDLKHFFGGYITKLNLAKRLATHGLRVRLLTTDPVGALPTRWREVVESYAGLGGLFEAVEVVFGRGPVPVEVSPADQFIATTWWTAHIASAALGELRGGDRFVYLIQEYEPFTFPMGSYAALAERSYRFEHFAAFSSELLRDYFRRHCIGVYQYGVDAGDANSLAFTNAITPVVAPTAAELVARTTRKLLFYARPEAHAARNMYELGMLALARAVEEDLLPVGCELMGIGTVTGRRTVPLGETTSLTLLPRADQGAYAELLRECDIGLALMYTPHPSLVPIEMASAGMLAVTNSFENKTPDGMRAISPNIIAVEPSVEGVLAGLADAASRVGDLAGRLEGSRVAWSRTWNECFDERVLDRVSEVLGRSRPGA